MCVLGPTRSDLFSDKQRDYVFRAMRNELVPIEPEFDNGEDPDILLVNNDQDYLLSGTSQPVLYDYYGNPMERQPRLEDIGWNVSTVNDDEDDARSWSTRSDIEEIDDDADDSNSRPPTPPPVVSDTE
jgi:hypothetical protein